MKTEHAIERLYSSREIATLCNKDIRTVSRVAPRYASRKVGQIWVWSASDLANYKAHQRNRKRKTEKEEKA